MASEAQTRKDINVNDQPKPPRPPLGSTAEQKRGPGLIGRSFGGVPKPAEGATAHGDVPPNSNQADPPPQKTAQNLRSDNQPRPAAQPVQTAKPVAQPPAKTAKPAPTHMPQARAPQNQKPPAQAVHQQAVAKQNPPPKQPAPVPQQKAPPLQQPAKQAQPKPAAEQKPKPAAKAAPPAPNNAPKPKAKQNPQPQEKPAPAKEKPKNKKPANDIPKVIEVAPMATPARPKARHWGLLASFLALVLFPSVLAAFYLAVVANDQYESRVGFSVRAEETATPIDLFGGISGLSSASSSDTDILFQFIQSQEMVQRVDTRLNLREIYSKPTADPIFSLGSSSSIEELMDYWSSMVRIYYDPGTGLIEVRSYAFTANDAQAISTAIFEESSAMINELSTIARADATRYAKEELEVSVERLITARQALTAFRNRTQIVDPTADIAGQMGILSTLQAQLAETMIEYDLLRETTRVNDPRLDQARRKIEVIESRIAEERQKLGVGVGDAGGYAEVIGEFEKLQVDRQFAEQTYVSARTAYDSAVAEAQRKSRYLAAYVQPTLAETATAPKRLLLFAMVAGFAFMAWAIGSLVYYSLRDRR